MAGGSANKTANPQPNKTMSNFITLGKNRKGGKWVILADPEQPYDKHLSAYQKIATAAPVSEEFITVVLGRIHDSAPRLTLITGKEKDAQKQRDVDYRKSLEGLPKAAELRQALITENQAKAIETQKQAILDEKNKATAALRKATGQSETSPEPPKTTVKQSEPEK